MIARLPNQKWLETRWERISKPLVSTLSFKNYTLTFSTNFTTVFPMSLWTGSLALVLFLPTCYFYVEYTVQSPEAPFVTTQYPCLTLPFTFTPSLSHAGHLILWKCTMTTVYHNWHRSVLEIQGKVVSTYCIHDKTMCSKLFTKKPCLKLWHFRHILSIILQYNISN